MDLNSSDCCPHNLGRGISLNYFVYILTKKKDLNNLPRIEKIFDGLLADWIIYKNRVVFLQLNDRNLHLNFWRDCEVMLIGSLTICCFLNFQQDFGEQGYGIVWVVFRLFFMKLKSSRWSSMTRIPQESVLWTCIL